MSRLQDIARYLDNNCDCPVRITAIDQSIHYVWLTGETGGPDPCVTGAQHGKGYREEWKLPTDQVARIRRISVEKYRELSGWAGVL